MSGTKFNAPPLRLGNLEWPIEISGLNNCQKYCRIQVVLDSS